MREVFGMIGAALLFAGVIAGLVFGLIGFVVGVTSPLLALAWVLS